MNLTKQILIVTISCLVNFHVVAQQALPDSILSTLKTSHPRLLVGSLQEFEDIKKRSETDAFPNMSIANIIGNADTVLREPVVVCCKAGCNRTS